MNMYIFFIYMHIYKYLYIYLYIYLSIQIYDLPQSHKVTVVITVRAHCFHDYILHVCYASLASVDLKGFLTSGSLITTYFTFLA